MTDAVPPGRVTRASARLAARQVESLRAKVFKSPTAQQDSPRMDMSESPTPLARVLTAELAATKAAGAEASAPDTPTP